MKFPHESAPLDERVADILVVDDDAGTIQWLGRVLGDVGKVRFATRGADAVALARKVTPDLVLLDGQMPGMDGFEVCAKLKADPDFAHVPVIFVTSSHDEAFEVRGFEVGAVDFIRKPVNPTLLLARVRAQLRFKRMTDEMHARATVDVLTGVANRRRFDAALETELNRARRSKEPLSLLFVDVDHFKLFNDRYGHPAGDVCLAAVAKTLVDACLRPADLVARYGGEEFMVLLPATTATGAEEVARRIVAGLSRLALPHDASPTAPHVSVSGGIATEAKPLPDSASSLIEAADVALYEAKTAGRARFHRAQSDLAVGASVATGDGAAVSLRRSA